MKELQQPGSGPAAEKKAEREKLPLYKTLPAAAANKLTPANGFPKAETFHVWHRSHGDASGARYSALDQINRSNVKQLEVAWTYHSKDGVGNIQCNPVIGDGVMFAPTVGEHVVAIDLATGKEFWRFKPGGRPAHRGLIYDPSPARVLFPAGGFLHALDAKTGLPEKNFGNGGRAAMPGTATAGPAISANVIVVPGF